MKAQPRRKLFSVMALGLLLSALMVPATTAGAAEPQPLEAHWQVYAPDDAKPANRVKGDPDTGVTVTSTGKTFYYAKVEGDFQLDVRLTRITTEGGGRPTAGVHLVESLDDDLEHGMGETARMGGDRPTPDNPAWLRIVRKGDHVGTYRGFARSRMRGSGLSRSKVTKDAVYIGLILEGGQPNSPAAATFDRITLSRPRLGYRTSWFGNTLRGPINNTVNFNMTGLYTAPDGTCFVTSFFEEQGHTIAAYRDGKQVAPDHKTPKAGMAVAANSKHLFTSHGNGFQRLNHQMGDREFVKVSDSDKPQPVRGLAADDQTVFVSNTTDNRIELYDAKTLEHRRHIDFERPGPLALGDAGTLWVVREAFEDSVFEMVDDGSYEHQAEIVKLNARTGKVEATITDVEVPTGVAVDGPRQRLLVAENGQDQQIRIYNIADKPNLIGTVGEKGGMYAGVPGEVQDDKFNGLTGVGVDGEGNIYVSGNGWPYQHIASGLMANQTSLRAFAPDAINQADPKAKWILDHLGYIFDGATLDPADKTFAYAGADQIFRMDWSKDEPGSEATYEAYTANRKAFPMEYMGRRGRSTPYIRRLEGERFLSLGGNTFYRFDRDEHGYTAIPAALIATQGYKKTPKKWPENVPVEKRTPYVWVDGHGGGPVDGKAQKEEYWTHEHLKGGAGTFFDIDSDGNLWFTGGWRANRLVRLAFTGLKNGVPTWDQQPEVIEVPKPFEVLQWSRYDAATDTMTLAGLVPLYPGSPDIRNRTNYVAQYPNWSKGNRESSIEFPLTLVSGGYFWNGGHGFAVVDHFVCVPGRPGNISVIDMRHGNRVIEFVPGPEVHGLGGFFDKDTSSVQAFYLPEQDEYVALCQSNAWGKILVYRWQPEKTPSQAPVSAPEAVARTGSGHVLLTWNTQPAGIIEGYHVYRATSEAGPYQRITNDVYPKPNYTDTTASNGTTYFYRVSIVNAAGEGPQSEPVKVTPQEATAEFVGIDARTQGNWRGKYGRDGFYIVGDLDSENNPTQPDYFEIDGGRFHRKSGHGPRYVDMDQTRFLLKAHEDAKKRAGFPPGSGYSKNQQEYLLEFTDGQTHTLTLYAAGGHNNGYSTQIKLVDASTGEVLDEREFRAKGEDQGRYISWNVSGSVRLHYNKIKGGFGNYLNGFFLDPADAKLPTKVSPSVD